MQRKLFPVLAMIALLGAPALAQQSARGPAASEDDGPLAAPPAPAVLDLRADLDRMLRSRNWRGDVWGVVVVSLDRGDTLFTHEPDRPLVPASNMKLFTTAAALYFLGPEFRFNTFLFAGGPLTNGVLEGDLILYGTGDPTLSDRFGGRLTVFRAFADTLAARGVREIRGDVVGDASYFEGPGSGEGWRDRYINAAYAAPASALTFAENIVAVRIAPAEQAGAPPLVDAVPGGQRVGIVNEATTAASGSTLLTVTRTSYEGPLVVRGRIRSGSRPVMRYVPVAEPARYAAAALHELLDERGIIVTGGVRAVSSAAESRVTGRAVFAPAFPSHEPLRVVAIHQSPPLRDVLEIINKDSHNLMAEQTLRTVGRVAAGRGAIEGGARAVLHLLERAAGSTPVEFHQADGSGLSTLNRASARTIVNLLGFMAESPMWEEYWATLPEAGAPDGLSRMRRTPAASNLRAKTGTIERVSALSGYVRAHNGEHLAFSIMVNDVPSTWRAKRIEDEIGARLAAFDRPGYETPALVATAPADPAAAPPIAAQPPADSTTGQAPASYTIRSGDTLDGIARQHGVTVAELQAANPEMTPRRLIPGDEVVIPEGGTAPAPGPAERTHTIRSGDTMESIAQRYGTTVAALRAANPGLNPRRLIPGRTIRIR